MSENRKILLRNAFLGKFDRSQMKEVDNAIAIVKEAKAETEKALEVGNNQFKQSTTVSLTRDVTYSLQYRALSIGKVNTTVLKMLL